MFWYRVEDMAREASAFELCYDITIGGSQVTCIVGNTQPSHSHELNSRSRTPLRLRHTLLHRFWEYE